MGINRIAVVNRDGDDATNPRRKSPMERRQRVLRGHTRDPWPCCNTPADECWGRPKGTICDECKQSDRDREGRDPAAAGAL